MRLIDIDAFEGNLSLAQTGDKYTISFIEEFISQCQQKYFKSLFVDSLSPNLFLAYANGLEMFLGDTLSDRGESVKDFYLVSEFSVDSTPEGLSELDLTLSFKSFGRITTEGLLKNIYFESSGIGVIKEIILTSESGLTFDSQVDGSFKSKFKIFLVENPGFEINEVYLRFFNGEGSFLSFMILGEMFVYFGERSDLSREIIRLAFAKYVYVKYTENENTNQSKIGVVKPKGENSKPASPITKIVMQWNEMVELHNQLFLLFPKVGFNFNAHCKKQNKNELFNYRNSLGL